MENMENMENKVNFVSENTVYIHGAFSEDIIELLPQINALIQTQKTLTDGKIIFDINSTGGKLDIVILLINLIEKAKKAGIIVETVVQYAAYSGGSLLACSGTIGHRYISEYAEHMCHFSITRALLSTPEHIQRETAFVLRQQHHMQSMYKKYCEPTAQKGYVNKLLEKMKIDFYIPAKECIKYGLADKIL